MIGHYGDVAEIVPVPDTERSVRSRPSTWWKLFAG
jgi:hypothetical protein